MMTSEQLTKFENMATECIDKNTLSDISDLKINGKTSAHRLESFVSQIGNPYCFRVGNTPVRISFHNDRKPLESILRQYFIGLKN